MNVAHLDFETYCELDIKKVGLHRYADHPSCDVWMANYAINDGPVKRWQPGDPPPIELFNADQFYAHNADFEWIIWWRVMYRKHHWPDCPTLQRWHCSMALAHACGMPGKLDELARALRLEHQKNPKGKALITKWSKPKRDGTKPHPLDDPDSFAEFCDYCDDDVRAERDAVKHLPIKQLQPQERVYWELQCNINNRGIGVDVETTQKLALAVRAWKEHLAAECAQITGGIEPTQLAKLREWLNANGAFMPDMKAETVKATIKQFRDYPHHAPARHVQRVIQIQQETSKSSTKKYEVFLSRTSGDRRLRGTQTYHGASTGRVTHPGVQLGNLPRADDFAKAAKLAQLPKDLAEAVQLIEHTDLVADPFALSMFHDPMLAYSAMIRSVLVADSPACVERPRPPKVKFCAGDYSQIEARFLAWYCRQMDLVNDFAAGIDRYKIMASRIFGIPVEEIGKDSRERYVGKQCVLAAGFGVGPGGFIARCAKDGVDIEPEEAERAVSEYRGSVPMITRRWYQVQNAAMNAVRNPTEPQLIDGVVYVCNKSKTWLACKLLNGKFLFYYKPHIANDPMFGEGLYCMGSNAKIRWGQISLWYGTLIENIVQASCREIMVAAMLRLERAGFRVVLTVHDEIVCEAPIDAPYDDFHRIMAAPVEWAPGLPVKVEGWEGKRYRK